MKTALQWKADKNGRRCFRHGKKPRLDVLKSGNPQINGTKKVLAYVKKPQDNCR
jgi:hypothetical protein